MHRSQGSEKVSKTMELRQPTVAITGAGSGLGRAVAIKLAAKGYRVFGTARSEQHVADLEKASAGNAAVTIADITDQSAVTAWVGKVRMSWVSAGWMSSSATLAL